MHDLRALRDAPQLFIDGWTRRGMSDAAGVVAAILEQDAALRAAQTESQTVQARRNEASKQIGAAKSARDEGRAAELMAEVAALKTRGPELEAQVAKLQGELTGPQGVLATLPNLPAADVPEGEDEHGNVEVSRWGDPAQTPAARLNAPKDHATLGEALGLMDFERAARMSGARFVALKGGLARLERALGQFMLDRQTGEGGYTEVSPPLLVRDQAMFGTGQLPKFYDEQFTATRMSERERLLRQALRGLDDARAKPTASLLDLVFDELAKAETEEDLWLIPTAEVSLTNLAREEITPAERLPMRMTALTPSFRSEAGASGRDTRGMIRQHQFYKVELVSITAPEDSDAEHERMTRCAEGVLEALGLPYRRMLLCAGDMGFTARKTYDLEVWLPSENGGEGGYREISSCSNCGDFQARRMEARFKAAGEKGTRFVHTLNGSGLAVGRTLVAVIENYQQPDGSIAVPPALTPYMGGVERITAAA